MKCETCGTDLEDAVNFCPNCGNSILQSNSVIKQENNITNQDNPVNNQVNSVDNQNNIFVDNRADGWKRVLAVVIDGLIFSPIVFFIFVFSSIMIAIISENSGNNMIGSIGIMIAVLFVANPMLVHTLFLLVFNGSLGTKIMGIVIKNKDGSEPDKIRFLYQNLLTLCFTFFSPAIIASAIMCICGKQKQLLSDQTLGLQAFKK